MIRPDDIRDALAKITADPDETLKVIDQEIQCLELEIKQLLNARKLVSGRKKYKPRAAPKAGTGTLGAQQSNDLEKSIIAYVETHGPSTCGDIAEALEVIPVVVGTTVKKSNRLFKDGSYVNLHEDTSEG